MLKVKLINGGSILKQHLERPLIVGAIHLDVTKFGVILQSIGLYVILMDPRTVNHLIMEAVGNHGIVNLAAACVNHK